jgi:hypothetical protein
VCLPAHCDCSLDRVVWLCVFDMGEVSRPQNSCLRYVIWLESSMFEPCSPIPEYGDRPCFQVPGNSASRCSVGSWYANSIVCAVQDFIVCTCCRVAAVCEAIRYFLYNHSAYVGCLRCGSMGRCVNSPVS